MKKRGVGILEGMVLFSGSILPWIGIFSLIEMHRPETFIGTEGLNQVRNYLYWEFFGTVGIGISITIAVLLSGLVSESHRISVARRIGAVLFAVLTMAFTTEYTRIHTQTKKNAYSGFSLMKTAALIMDIEKDLQEQKTTELPQAEYELMAYHYIYKRARGSSHRMTEYGLNQGDELMAQISPSDYFQLENSIFFNGEHIVRLYENSGLIAWIDDRQISEFTSAESAYNITYDENAGFIRKEVLRGEEDFDTLWLVIERNEHPLERCRATGESELIFRPLIDGNFKIYLEMNWNGRPTVVSNTLTYVSEGLTPAENIPHKAEITATDGVLHYEDQTYQFSLDIPSDIEMQILDSEFVSVRGYDDDRRLAQSEINPELSVDIVLTKSEMSYSVQEYLNSLKMSMKNAIQEEKDAPNATEGRYLRWSSGTSKGILCVYALPDTGQKLYVRLEYLFTDEEGRKKAIESMKSFTCAEP